MPSDGDDDRPPAVNGQPIDFHPRSGSTDATAAQMDADVPVKHSVGEGTTTFNVEDVPDDEVHKYHRLYETHIGKRYGDDDWNEELREYNVGRDIKRMVEFCHLGEQYVPLVADLVTQISFDEEGTRRREAAILAAITLACNTQDFDPRPEVPIVQWNRWDHEGRYAELRRVNDIDPEDVVHFRQVMSLNKC